MSFCPCKSRADFGVDDGVSPVLLYVAGCPVCAVNVYLSICSQSAVEVRELPGVGKGLFAARALVAGTDVVVSSPLAAVALDGMWRLCCAACFQSVGGTSSFSALRTCSSCKGIKYCSAACQVRDRRECSLRGALLRCVTSRTHCAVPSPMVCSACNSDKTGWITRRSVRRWSGACQSDRHTRSGWWHGFCAASCALPRWTQLPARRSGVTCCR